MDSDQTVAAALPDPLAGTVAGADGPVPVAELGSVVLVINGAKAHTCAACGSPIPVDSPSMLLNAGSRQWRLCPNCAPETLSGYRIAWGRRCEWRASRVPRGDRPPRASDWPWRPTYGSGWDRPPVTPEDREAVERQEQAIEDAQQEALEQQIRQHAQAGARVAIVRDPRTLHLIDTICDLAAESATSVGRRSSRDLATEASRLIPEMITSIDRYADLDGLRFNIANAVVLHMCWEAATRGYETGHRAGAKRSRPSPGSTPAAGRRSRRVSTVADLSRRSLVFVRHREAIMAAAAAHEATSVVLVGSTAPREHEDSAACDIVFLGAIAEGAPLLDTDEFSTEEFLSALEVQLRCDIDILSIGDLESFEDLEAE